MRKRGSGILCHITSLPSPYGIGDLGPGAYAFADFLHQARQSYWQVLPLNPTNQGYGNSPFTSMSSCCGNTLLISPDLLASEGLISESEMQDHPPFPGDKVDYGGALRYKQTLFQRAYARFKERGAIDHDYHRFCSGHADWLEDHALFTAISQHLGQTPLCDWPAELKEVRSGAVQRLREELADAVQLEKFLQYLFFKQWNSLKNYCNGKGIQIIGDFPMFMNYDCADIWVRPELFKVDAGKKPYVVAGSPPDSFSAEGQIFNCAVYDWDALKRAGFSWWIRRFHLLFKMFDFVRIDHFRGLIAYWEVPGGEQNALNGKWVPGGVYDFMDAMLVHFPMMPVLAEDLGVITPDVREAMERYTIPGIRLLNLAFHGEGYDSYLPHNHIQNCVVYTATHDTNTVEGWFNKSENRGDRERMSRYLGREVENGLSWEVIRLAMMSVAHTSIILMQDVLGAGEEARMNTPGEAEGNWLWRLPASDLGGQAARLAEMTLCYGRALPKTG